MKTQHVGRYAAKLVGACLLVTAIVSAQAPVQPTEENTRRTAAGLKPIYRTTVVERSTKAISYKHRGGATKIDFSGTPLMPGAHGQAKVESKQGYIEIEVEFRDLPEATQFGNEYLTYVLWAITPEGRTSNLGEVLRNGTSGKLDVTTELQAFGLIVTAEPYFAVSRPSNVVVMENEVRPDTKGKVEEIDAKYELLERGQYEHLANVLDLQLNRKMPLELYEARNAVAIARSSGADQYATETFQKAESNLKQAESYRAQNEGSKQVAMAARQSVQMAEDSRAIAEKRQDEERVAAERQAGLDRQLSAENGRAAAQSETDRVTREAAEARTKAELDAARIKLNTDAQMMAAQAEADRLRRENDIQRAAAKNEADRLKLENDAKMAAAQTDLDRAAKDKSAAEIERAELRAQLLMQFNAILQTRDTARGLIVNMSDVLFDTAKFTLRPEAREKLAKVAGIVAMHPGLRLDVEGHTDNVGGDDYNQQLSEERGSAVRDYLTAQGILADSVTTKGFGKTQPVASNETSAGRQQNRRVELVISGEVIGVEIGHVIAVR
jgi:outer membrane protein OmpA-like peptidoglycan-associated protein